MTLSPLDVLNPVFHFWMVPFKIMAFIFIWCWSGFHPC